MRRILLAVVLIAAIAVSAALAYNAGDRVAVYGYGLGVDGAHGTVNADGSVTLDGPISPSSDHLWPEEPHHPAVSADAFRSSLGVNVHMSYLNTAYGNVGQVQSALSYLGITQLRDGECATCQHNGRDQQVQLAQLGYRFNMISGDFSNSPGHRPEENVPAAVSDLGPALESLETVNEPDIAAGYSMANLHAYDQRLFGLKPPGVDLVSAAFVNGGNYTAYGDQSAIFDHGNFHPYPGNGEPTNITSALSTALKPVPGKPVFATETGYHNALAYTGGHKPVSEKAAGVYMPRIYLEYWRRGVARTFLYELVDENPDPGLANYQQHFGLFRNDWTPKPAADAIHALSSAVGSGAPASLGGLDYTISAPVWVHDVLIEKGDGSYVLALYRNAAAWDTTNAKDLPISAKTVTVTFGQPTSGGRTLSVSVGADPVYVPITSQ